MGVADRPHAWPVLGHAAAEGLVEDTLLVGPGNAIRPFSFYSLSTRSEPFPGHSAKTGQPYLPLKGKWPHELRPAVGSLCPLPGGRLYPVPEACLERTQPRQSNTPSNSMNPTCLPPIPGDGQVKGTGILGNSMSSLRFRGDGLFISAHLRSARTWRFRDRSAPARKPCLRRT